MSDGKLLHSEKKIFRFLYIFLWRGGRQCGGGQCVKLHADKIGQGERVGKHVRCLRTSFMNNHYS